jgi:diguanylate cyclase (GGDEF)-like protein
LEAQLKRQALHDPLTGLPNRALFVKQLRRRLMRRQRDLTRRFAVLFIDLDHFKPINDTLGHAVGDLLLAEVARRLESVVRPDDLVARMGGDEFTVLLDNVDQADEAAKIVQRILDQLSAPFSLQEPDPGGAVKWHEAQISASIGVATPSSQHETADELLRAADAAMYRAKARGRNCFEISEVACNSASAR